jgi:hypothetical protein
MTTKICRRCGEAKPTDQFRADPRYRDGYASWCSECHRVRNSSWAKENRARLSAKSAVWRAANPDKTQEIDRKHKRGNKAVLAAKHAAWAKVNRDKRRATDAKRKAAKLRATPPWADHQKIQAIYRRALEIERQTGERMHVDHAIPLQHPLVCGLHCEANLQILPGPLNEAKRNRWCPIEEAQKQLDMFIKPASAA